MEEKVYQDIVDIFYKGLADDPRIQDPGNSGISAHVDIFSYPKKLLPYRAMEADENTAYDIVNFLYNGTNLFGLGIVSGGSKVQLYKKASDPITGSWAAATNGADSAGSRSTKAFTLFHGYAYGLSAGTRIWAADTTEVSAFTTTAFNITAYTNTCRGIVTRDDMYLQPYDNKIAKKNGAGSGPTDQWTVALTLPTDYVITDIFEIGDKVMVFARPTNPALNSKGFIWNKVDSDVDDTIDFGPGDLLLGDSIGGEVIGVSSTFGISSFGFKASVVFRNWTAGTLATPFETIFADEGTAKITIPGNHTKVRNDLRFSFAMKLIKDGVTYNQMFEVGRLKSGYPLAVSGGMLVNNDTTVTSIDGAYRVGNYVWVAYNNSEAVSCSVNRPNDQATYTGVTPYFPTQIIDGSRVAPKSAKRNKTFISLGCTFEPLTSGQSVSLYYKKLGDSSFTLVFTESTTSEVEREASGADTNGDGTVDADFVSGKEFVLKVVPIGGAQVTAIYYKFQVNANSVNDD